MNKACHTDLTKNSVKKECLLECPYVHRYCGVLTVNDLDFSLSVPVGLPVATWAMDYFSAWIVTFKLNGMMDATFSNEITSKYCKVCGTDIQRDGCVNQTKPADVINSDTGPVVLTIKDMLSTYIVAGVVMMIAPAA